MRWRSALLRKIPLDNSFHTPSSYPDSEFCVPGTAIRVLPDLPGLARAWSPRIAFQLPNRKEYPCLIRNKLASLTKQLERLPTSRFFRPLLSWFCSVQEESLCPLPCMAVSLPQLRRLGHQQFAVSGNWRAWSQYSRTWLTGWCSVAVLLDRSLGFLRARCIGRQEPQVADSRKTGGKTGQRITWWEARDLHSSFGLPARNTPGQGLQFLEIHFDILVATQSQASDSNIRAISWQSRAELCPNDNCLHGCGSILCASVERYSNALGLSRKSDPRGKARKGLIP